MIEVNPNSFYESADIDREIRKSREKEVKRFIGYPLNILAEWRLVSPFINKNIIAKLVVFVERVIARLDCSEYDKETLFINYRDGGEPYGACDYRGKAMRVIKSNFKKTFASLNLKIASSQKTATVEYFGKVTEYEKCGHGNMVRDDILKIVCGTSRYIGKKSEVEQLAANLEYNKRFDHYWIRDYRVSHPYMTSLVDVGLRTPPARCFKRFTHLEVKYENISDRNPKPHKLIYDFKKDDEYHKSLGIVKFDNDEMISSGASCEISGSIDLFPDDNKETALERACEKIREIYDKHGEDVFSVAYRIDIFWQDVDNGKIVKGQFDAPLYVSKNMSDVKYVFDKIVGRYKTSADELGENVFVRELKKSDWKNFPDKKKGSICRDAVVFRPEDMRTIHLTLSICNDNILGDSSVVSLFSFSSNINEAIPLLDGRLEDIFVGTKYTKE